MLVLTKSIALLISDVEYPKPCSAETTSFIRGLLWLIAVEDVDFNSKEVLLTPSIWLILSFNSFINLCATFKLHLPIK